MSALNQLKQRVHALEQVTQRTDAVKVSRCAVIFFHKNLRKIYKHRWFQRCVVSVMEQSHQQFDVLEVNYGGDGFCLMNEFRHRKTAYFWNESFETHTEAMMFLLDKAFRELDYDVVFNTNLDDYYHLDRFKKQLACVVDDGFDMCSSYMTYITEKRGVDVETMVWGSHRYGFENEDERFVKGVATGATYVDEANIKAQLDKDHNVINHSCVCFTRRFWNARDANGNYLRYRDDKPFEDLSLWQRAAASPECSIAIVPESLIMYRLHENQIGEQNKKGDAEKDAHVDGGFKQGPSRDKHRIGIFCVCTGNYVEQYFEQLVLSVQMNFLPGLKKCFFVSTDNPEQVHSVCEALDTECFTVRIAKKGFPLDTLYRYKYLLDHGMKTELYCDVLYYLDVDMTVVAEVGEEVLPTASTPLVGTKHPGFAFSANKNGSPETRPESTAYIPESEYMGAYVAGGFNGGFSADFKQLARTVHDRINRDKARDIMAVWHDESQLNRYFVDERARFKVLEPDYCYPENYHEKLPCELPRILALSKDHVKVRDRGEKFKIVVNALGGLGNLFFQLCFGKFLELELNEEAERDGRPHRWELAVRADQKDDVRQGVFHYHVFDNVYRIGTDPDPENTYTISEISKSYVNTLPDLPRDMHLYVTGYFQSPLYFRTRFDQIVAAMDHTVIDAAREVFNAFALDAQPTAGHGQFVALHIRGGDYKLLHDYHCLQDQAYYDRCLAQLDGDANRYVVLFTDDVPYAKAKYKLHYDNTARSVIDKYLPERYAWLKQSAELELFLMSQFNVLVCANSTYSLWAAYFAHQLNDAALEHAFLPDMWFGVNGPNFFSTEELLLSDKFRLC